MTESQATQIVSHGEEAPCNCKCVRRIKNLEDKISDLDALRLQVDKFQRLLDSLIDGSLLKKKREDAAAAKKTEAKPTPKVEDVKVPPVASLPISTPKPVEQQVIKVPSAPQSVQEFIDEGDDELMPEAVEQEQQLPIDSGDVENVEITPDFFGHFLLDNPDDGVGAVENDECVIEDDDEDIVQDDSARRSSRKRQRDRYDDSDSEDCFTLSSDSEITSEDISSDEDYKPSKGRGRGSRPNSSGNNYRKYNVKSGGGPSQTKQLLDLDTSNELMRSCTKRPGDIWECNVCGFMLSSLENMLLHVKYNHSTTTHTCPFCKVVVLCRSPKDALMHQVQCKLRPQGIKVQSGVPLGKSNVAVPSKLNSVAVPSRNNVASMKPKIATRNNVPTTHNRSTVAEIDEKVNQFVAELLEPSSSKATRSKGAAPPAVVTLSSDDESD